MVICSLEVEYMPKKAKKPKVNKDKGLQTRVTFLTTEAEEARLKQYSETTGIPMGVILRRAVDAYLPKAARPRKVTPAAAPEPGSSTPAPF